MELSHLIKLPVVDNVKVSRASYNKISTSEGTLCLTGHHLIYSSRTNKDDELMILHSLIDTVENRIKENKPILIIKCKTFQIIQIDFPTIDHCQLASNSIESLSNIQSDEVKYPFYYKLKFIPIQDGWQSYTIESEYYRIFSNNDSEWRISNLNKDYKICSTYPEKIIVHKLVEDSWLKKSSEFRFGGRFPVLSYYQKDKKAFIMRSSQPMTGTGNRRCKEDESILGKSLPSGKKGVIFDTRDLNLAKASCYKSGGYESDSNYPLWKRYYINLERYDQLHVSYSKLIEACNESSLTNDKWLSKLESSNWLNNVRQAIYISCCVADEIFNKNSCVLVHGYDGIDNTLVVTSLSQILLNPDTRTLIGFQALIEREWIQGGHPFSKRYFKSAYSSTVQKNEGPVFVLFLDCVWQIYKQFQLSFEFNEEFLLKLFDNLYASEYGTFLGNCERERTHMQLSFRTYSLWSFINQPENMKNYINILYEPNNEQLWPNISPFSLDLWSNLYLRYQLDQSAWDEAKSEIVKLKEKEIELKSKAIKLRKEILDLEKDAIDKKLLLPESIE